MYCLTSFAGRRLLFFQRIQSARAYVLGSNTRVALLVCRYFWIINLSRCGYMNHILMKTWIPDTLISCVLSIEQLFVSLLKLSINNAISNHSDLQRKQAHKQAYLKIAVAFVRDVVYILCRIQPAHGLSSSVRAPCVYIQMRLYGWSPLQLCRTLICYFLRFSSVLFKSAIGVLVLLYILANKKATFPFR